jgi:hypothetical protein
MAIRCSGRMLSATHITTLASTGTGPVLVDLDYGWLITESLDVQILSICWMPVGAGSPGLGRRTGFGHTEFPD